jgi:isoleucyl-tRNA synthetase
MDSKSDGVEELHTVESDPKGPLALREEEVLKFWQKQNIFEKSLKKPAPKGEYVFYDGPPFATGLPHFGHILQSAIKDAIPRYRTMRGYRVDRRWGWDCHGLPLENQIEQELGIKTKREIEQLGVEKFNTAAKNAVLRYAQDWKYIIPRLGRWVDMEHDYRTMDASYTESIWWAFKNLYDRKLIYEGFKAMQYCPRCGTTLSNNEVALGYQDIEDISVYVKLPLVDEPHTSLLIWTTTPWTLPGNTAAAVNPDATYVKVKVGDDFFVLAKERVEKIIPQAEIMGEISGRELIGKRYEPPFSYFKEELHKHKTHAWRVYGASYVTLDSGTGIVHLAPAFGAEDLVLAQKEKIPLIHHVTDEGKFTAMVTDFANLPVKPKGHHQDTDKKIVENLTARGLLFKEEKIKHPYPHCWRCDTPLLNWAANSWFVNVQKIKPKLLKQNARVQWVPKHVGTGRFANGLASAPDWAISRGRFWGAPLPVWRHSKTKEVKVVGSVDELLSLVHRSGNQYFVMRHGEALNNVKELLDSKGDGDNHLTDKGRTDVLRGARELSKQHIDLIIVSPLLRTKETAEIVQKTLGLPSSALMVDERLREIGFGDFNGKNINEWREFISRAQRFITAPEGGETYSDVRRRVGEFIFEIERRYANKNILVVTHECPASLLASVAARKTTEKIIADDDDTLFLNPGAFTSLPFVPFPHNTDYELDLHRPYIDDIPLGSAVHGSWQRVPDVFDCWFESGSMPFASNHYPFEKEVFDPKRFFGLGSKGYPADFIIEGIDQTRGWFYSLIVLGVALFGKTPYQSVITNGLILAEDGRKMSKKLKNYPDPLDLVGKYGADALRYYLLSSASIRGEDLRFSARGVEEVSKKILMRLDNVRSFYELYAPMDPASEKLSASPLHVLDKWILSRLNQFLRETTEGFEAYELDIATRPLMSFVDDLSTWYLRRSRDRFKKEGEDKQEALVTLRFVLITLAHAMAPVLPFFAEDLYRRLKKESELESVHLSNWPVVGAVDEQLLKDMAAIRVLASQALQARERVGIKVRQPLAKLVAKALPADVSLRTILAEEVNVKEVVEDVSLTEDLSLDTILTPELKEEGLLRDYVRLVQEWRKDQGFSIGDRPKLLIQTNEDAAFLEKFTAELIAQTGLFLLKIEEGEARKLELLTD